MFRKHYIVKINLPGGIVSAGDLYSIVEAAGRARVTDMQFGARQQLFVRTADQYGAEFLRELTAAGIFFETEEECHPNISSSYVTEGVFGRSQWVSEGLYKDILDGFDYRPRLKINLVESSQSFVPFFTGHLNFISSPLNNHWHLVVRRPGTNERYSWRTAVYSPDIPRVSQLIGQSLPEWGDRLYDTVMNSGGFPSGPEAPPLRLQPFQLPYYEGFNRYGSKYWLGIYRREELFPLAFLRDICLICRQTKIGQLYTTPWKSLLIKGIGEEDLQLWEYVLGKYRMNVRHASNELNWQMEDFCPDGLRLKRSLVRQLDQEDVRTEGLTFSIKMHRGSGLSASIVIRRQEEVRKGQGRMLDRYDLWHTADFHPNSGELVLFREGLEKETLFTYIVSLCKEFYQRQSQLDTIRWDDLAGGHRVEDRVGAETGYECRHCLTQYLARYGDPDAGVAAGTAFEQLPPDYVCPVCGAARTDYRILEKTAPIQERLS